MTQRHKPHHLAEPCIKYKSDPVEPEKLIFIKEVQTPFVTNIGKNVVLPMEIATATSVTGILDFTALITACSNSMFIVRGVYCSSSFKVSNAYSYIHCLNRTGGTAYHEMMQILHRSVRSPVAQLKRFQSFSVYFCQSHAQLEAKTVLQSLNVCTGYSC